MRNAREYVVVVEETLSSLVYPSRGLFKHCQSCVILCPQAGRQLVSLTAFLRSVQVESSEYTLDHPQLPPSLPNAIHLALALQLIIALKRDTRQETRYTLFDLNPIPHQLRQFLRPSLSLRNKLHPRSSRIVPNTVLGGVAQCRLKDKRGAEIILRHDPHLPVIVKCDLDAEDRRECLAKLGRLGSEHLSEAQHPLFLLAQLVL